MNDAVDDADRKRRRRIKVRRQTRWVAALLEGIAAIAFVVFALRGYMSGPSLPAQVAFAFFAAAVSSYVVWPIANDENTIHYWRAATAGFLVVPLSGFLCGTLGMFAYSFVARGKVGTGVADFLFALLLIFGWVTVPLGVGAALLAAAWGNARFRRAD